LSSKLNDNSDWLIQLKTTVLTYMFKSPPVKRGTSSKLILSDPSMMVIRIVSVVTQSVRIVFGHFSMRFQAPVAPIPAEPERCS